MTASATRGARAASRDDKRCRLPCIIIFSKLLRLHVSAMLRHALYAAAAAFSSVIMMATAPCFGHRRHAAVSSTDAKRCAPFLDFGGRADSFSRHDDIAQHAASNNRLAAAKPSLLIGDDDGRVISSCPSDNIIYTFYISTRPASSFTLMFSSAACPRRTVLPVTPADGREDAMIRR